MTTLRVDETSEVAQSATVEVKHPQGGVGAFGMRLVHRMPVAAVWAVELVSSLEVVDPSRESIVITRTGEVSRCRIARCSRTACG